MAQTSSSPEMKNMRLRREQNIHNAYVHPKAPGTSV